MGRREIGPFCAARSVGVVLYFVTQPVKRKIFIGFTLVILLAAIGYVMRTPSSVDWTIVEPKMREAFNSHGYIMMSERMSNPSEVSLPFRVWLHRPSPRWQGPAHLEVGFPNGAECWTVRRRDSPNIDCVVRYLDGQASVVEIRFPAAAKADGKDIAGLLESEFPGLPIRLTRQ